MHKRKRYGFTVVELLIVIVIIGILASLVLIGYNGVQEQARKSKALHDIDQISKAIDVARTKSNKVLYQITGNTVTDLWCATQPIDPALLPKTHPCWTDYYNALDKISKAADVNINDAVDPWGRPYMIDENEGFNGPCYQDTVAIYSHPFKQQWVPDEWTPGENIPLSGLGPTQCKIPSTH